MQVFGPSHLHGPQAIGAPHKAYAPQQNLPAPSATPVDQLDISPQADLVSRVRDAADIRHDLVARIRAEIEAGTYETEARLDGAISRLLDEIG